MEDNIETFDLTPSETHESSESQDLPLQEMDDPLGNACLPSTIRCPVYNTDVLQPRVWHWLHDSMKALHPLLVQLLTTYPALA